MLTYALTGRWGGPEHLLAAGYMQLAREMDVALDMLGRIEAVGDRQKQRLMNVTRALRGVQERLAAMPMVARMFKDASEEGGAW